MGMGEGMGNSPYNEGAALSSASDRTGTSDPLSTARTLARLLDTAGRIPGTNVRFGLDPILGLVPGLGDVAGAALTGYIVLVGARLGASRSVIARMVLNIGIDALVGVVPVLGDVFDVAWKANTRNLALLERHLERPTAVARSSRAVVAGAIGALALLALGGIALAVWVVRVVIGALG
jgi:hypothetical protein